MSVNYKNIYLSIGALSQALGIHQRTLRIYDKQGILTPSRTPGDRRSYAISDLERAKFILFLSRNLGINLAGIKFVIAVFDEYKIKPENYFKHTDSIIKKLNITTSEQQNNILKNSKRGRPKIKK